MYVIVHLYLRFVNPAKTTLMKILGLCIFPVGSQAGHSYSDKNGIPKYRNLIGSYDFSVPVRISLEKVELNSTFSRDNLDRKNGKRRENKRIIST